MHDKELLSSFKYISNKKRSWEEKLLGVGFTILKRSDENRKRNNT